MNVFVLCTGRSGSASFAKACKHFTNYSAAHESRSRVFGPGRFDYPPNHIEVDNHLAFQLGYLHQRYGNDACYVHLVRDRERVAKSFVRLIDSPVSNVRGFATGVLMRPELTDEELWAASLDYVDVVSANIKAFLRDKTRTHFVDIDDPVEAFLAFAEDIGAEGDLDAAVNTLTTPSNLKLNTAYAQKKNLLQYIPKALKRIAGG
ncbi:hypothetical protein [Mesorhizobium sp. YM1C-6-2]|uniref:hypothetical protein n=1 Tax=Mesorhizobium sp. YM1C-6-2 TaxID=1827501 RepID=UPI0011C39800|nr:hypothetical protein [Mesorhizobium sp. YM1C-6-2]